MQQLYTGKKIKVTDFTSQFSLLQHTITRNSGGSNGS
jgi:hypothetical protein